jgi:hypothetical protein
MMALLGRLPTLDQPNHVTLGSGGRLDHAAARAFLTAWRADVADLRELREAIGALAEPIGRLVRHVHLR